MRGSIIALRIAQKRVKELEEGIEKALIPTDTNPIVHPLTKLSDLRKTLKELIE